MDSGWTKHPLNILSFAVWDRPCASTNAAKIQIQWTWKYNAILDRPFAAFVASFIELIRIFSLVNDVPLVINHRWAARKVFLRHRNDNNSFSVAKIIEMYLAEVTNLQFICIARAIWYCLDARKSFESGVLSQKSSLLKHRYCLYGYIIPLAPDRCTRSYYLMLVNLTHGYTAVHILYIIVRYNINYYRLRIHFCSRNWIIACGCMPCPFVTADQDCTFALGILE